MDKAEQNKPKPSTPAVESVQPFGFRVGDRIRLTVDVDRYPHCIISKGNTGTITESGEYQIAVELDRYHPDLEHWDNALLWTDEQLEYYSEQTEPLFRFEVQP